jgi:hypothetical protein
MLKFKFGAAAVALMVFAAPAAHAGNTLSIEGSPEWKPAGTPADDYLKLGYSHSFDNNFVLGTTFQYTTRTDGTATDYEQAEINAGYKIKNGAFTLTPAIYLGYAFGNAPKVDHLNAGASELYYAATLAADIKLNDQFTWNLVQVRYRNAFNTTWITPKVQTGFTWNVDKQNAFYINAGYAWKDAGDGKGLQGDKYNVAVGYKFNF